MRPVSGVRRTHVDRCLRAAAALAALGLMVACSDSTGVRTSASQLAFSLGSPAASAAAQAAVTPIVRNGHTLDLTQVVVTVDRAELKRAHDDTCADDDVDHSGPGNGGDSDDCAEVKVGGTTVDLPLSGDVVTVPADALPAGMYREIEVRISMVQLKGTFDGEVFDVSLPVHAKSEIEFETPLTVVDGTPTSITVNIPVAEWLVNPDGSLVVPGTIATSPALLAQLEARITASLRAFEDRDHDGHDDHGNRGPG